MRSALFINKKEIPFRDIDLIRFSYSKDNLDHSVSIKHMYNDYLFGRGVEVIEDRDIYFKTRDLKINEVLYSYPYIECSKEAFLQLYEGKIEASNYRTNPDNSVDGKTAIKMLRLYSEAILYDHKSELYGLDEKIIADEFDIALNLKRSYSSKEGVIEEFIGLLYEKGIFYNEFEYPPSPAMAIKYFASRIKQGLDFFTDLPDYIYSEIY